MKIAIKEEPVEQHFVKYHELSTHKMYKVRHKLFQDSLFTRVNNGREVIILNQRTGTIELAYDELWVSDKFDEFHGTVTIRS